MNDDIHRQVFIKNIPYEISEDDLAEWCTLFGPISRCMLKRDRQGYSRGFAFVTFTSLDGHNSILSQAPHYCKDRQLLVRSACDQANSNDYQSNSSSDQLSQSTSCISTTDNVNATAAESSLTFDDDNHNRLGSLRDELEANLECMQIAHEHEIKILRDKLSREQKLRKEAEESHKEAEEDWRLVNDENLKLRTSLIKNVMQTFNIRKDLARQRKDQLKTCAQFEKQCEDMKTNQTTQ